MRVTIVAYGSRGDVQPIIALGRGLRQRGHQVRVLASPTFTPWIERHGLEALPTRVDIRAMLEGEGGAEWMKHGNNPRRQMQVMRRLLDDVGWDMALDAWQGCQDADLIISGFTSDMYAGSIAEKVGAQHVSALLQPSVFATRSGVGGFSAPLPTRDSLINLWFGKAVLEPAMWRWYGDLVNRFRREVLGFPPLDARANSAARRRMTILHGYSPHVVPPPHDWPPTYHTTGYWFLDEGHDWQPPAALADFLAAAPRPIAVGFGSMTGRDAEGMTRLVVDAVTRAGQRAVLLSGWSGLGGLRLPPHILSLDAAPHDWLFPRVAAVVHHGGAGTTAAALRAGVPSIVVPHIADQPFWGRRVAALGVGPPPIPRPKLSAEGLAAAIRVVVSDGAMRQCAAALAAHLRAEDGIGRALDLLSSPTPPSFPGRGLEPALRLPKG